MRSFPCKLYFCFWFIFYISFICTYFLSVYTVFFDCICLDHFSYCTRITYRTISIHIKFGIDNHKQECPLKIYDNANMSPWETRALVWHSTNRTPHRHSITPHRHSIKQCGFSFLGSDSCHLMKSCHIYKARSHIFMRAILDWRSQFQKRIHRLVKRNIYCS